MLSIGYNPFLLSNSKKVVLVDSFPFVGDSWSEEVEDFGDVEDLCLFIDGEEALSSCVGTPHLPPIDLKERS